MTNDETNKLAQQIYEELRGVIETYKPAGQQVPVDTTAAIMSALTLAAATVIHGTAPSIPLWAGAADHLRNEMLRICLKLEKQR